MKRLSQTTSTDTIDGPVPHLSLTYAGGTFLAPVKLRVVQRPPDARRKTPSGGEIWLSADRSRGLQLPEADKRGDKVAFALPGGGETWSNAA